MSDDLATAVSAVVRDRMGEDVTGHDWWHVEHVRRMSLQILTKEGSGSQEVIELAALMHDLEDHKFGGSDERIPATVRSVLEPPGGSNQLIDRVADTIRQVSFKGAGVITTPKTIEAKIVQDADRLDALGAIGIARTFAYGASRGRAIYDPAVAPLEHRTFEEYKSRQSHTINHFSEKLLLLKDRMNTVEGKRIAEHRHQVLVDFLKEFHAEWTGER